MIFGGNPPECNDRRSTSFAEKNYGDALNTLLGSVRVAKKLQKKHLKNGMSTP